MTRSRRPSAEYEASYRSFLRARGDRGSPRSPRTIFWPIVGHRLAGDLLVVGRAPNGWSVEWDATVDTSHDAIADAAAERRRASEGDGSDPMDWITWSEGIRTRYSTDDSAFWRVSRRVRAGLIGESEDWPRDLAWTDLAKIAPWGGGNPTGRALQVQREHAPALFAREVAEIAPARVLVMAGRWWPLRPHSI